MTAFAAPALLTLHGTCAAAADASAATGESAPSLEERVNELSHEVTGLKSLVLKLQEHYFLSHSLGVLETAQPTVGVGLVWWFGGKTGPW